MKNKSQLIHDMDTWLRGMGFSSNIETKNMISYEMTPPGCDITMRIHRWSGLTSLSVTSDKDYHVRKYWKGAREIRPLLKMSYREFVDAVNAEFAIQAALENDTNA